jgi:hypothetical protein
MILIFKVLKFLKNLIGVCLIIVKPFAICSISFHDKLFFSIPENVECTLSLLSI